MAELPAELAPPDPVPNRETVELFTYFLREFKGFMTHMDAALQVCPLSIDLMKQVGVQQHEGSALCFCMTNKATGEAFALLVDVRCRAGACHV
jgi:hypothetical protein